MRIPPGQTSVRLPTAPPPRPRPAPQRPDPQPDSGEEHAPAGPGDDTTDPAKD
jgi:hypothetical protein